MENSKKDDKILMLMTENLETENSHIESDRYQVCNALRINDSNLSMCYRTRQESIVVSPSGKKAGPPSQLSQLLGGSHMGTSAMTSPTVAKHP